MSLEPRTCHKNAAFTLYPCEMIVSLSMGESEKILIAEVD